MQIFSLTNRKLILVVSALAFIVLCAAYSNHFTNGFYFDDFNTIVNNSFVKDISNLPLFFTDIKYYGTNLGNQGYNPILVSLNAIDHWLAGEYNPVYFHASIFFWYILQLVLMFYLFKNIFNLTASNEQNALLALVLVAFYGIHAANAETINYIIMRSDSFSTLCVVASLLLYQIPRFRKYHLYLITMIIGIGTKETGVMFAPILFFYILLFEENVSLWELILFKKPKAILNTIKKSAPALIIAFGLLTFFIGYFLPEDNTLFKDKQTSDIWNYFVTQWYIIAHYIGNFVIPINLSVDKDFEIIKTMVDQRVLFSLGLILSLVLIAFNTSRHKKTLPIAFGIMWFFFSLAPTSSFKPLGQLANDHRTFMPYIGLVLSLGWYIGLMLIKHRSYIQGRLILKYGLPVLAMVIILSHAYGTHQRNEVWSSGESLWYDATIKSPKNGRVMMNYGLSQMAKGKYGVALEYFQKGEELMPYWPYIHINMGVLKQATGHPKEAEIYFLNAIEYQPNLAESYYYYGKWLNSQNRKEEAKVQLTIGQRLSPGHAGINRLLTRLTATVSKIQDDRIQSLLQLVEESPLAENFINLGLAYYKKGQYEKCIEASINALNQRPDYVYAYNNMCSAYNALGEWDKALAACDKALKIAPDYQLAKNNRQLVLLNKAKEN